MPIENRWRQVGIFLAAAGIGIIGMIVLPKQCAPKTEEVQNRAHAPAPTTLEAQRKQQQAAASAAQSKAALSGAMGFHDQLSALSQLPLEQNEEMLDDLMAKWALSDPQAAAEFVRQLPAGEFREAAGLSLCQTWAAEKPEEAAAWVKQNLPQGGLQGALGAVASVWARRAPEAVVAWIATLPESSDRIVAEGSLAQTWGETNPAAAAVWWKSLADENQPLALQPLLIGWAVNDPSAAANWLQNELTNHPQWPAAGVAGLVNEWSNRDAGEVSRWLNSLPEGEFYEAAVAAFSQSAATTSPKDALLWARTLTDPVQRQSSVLYALETWLDTDREAFVKSLPDQIAATTDPKMRQAVYDLLYRKDPNFKESLLKLADDTTSTETPDAPATDESTGGPVEGTEAQ